MSILDPCYELPEFPSAHEQRDAAVAKFERTQTHGHRHSASGFTFKLSGGLKAQWCSTCGALGVYHPDGRCMGWVRPDAVQNQPDSDAEAQFVDLLARARRTR